MTHTRSGLGWRWMILLVLYLTAGTWVTTIFTIYPGYNDHHKALFRDMVHGKAHRPFAHRPLVPLVIRAIDACMPPAWKTRFSDRFGDSKVARALGFDREDPVLFFVGFIVLALCFAGFALSLASILSYYYEHAALTAGLYALGCMVVLPFFFKYYNYLYDPGTLFTFSAAVALIVRRRLWLFGLVFALASLNRETAFLLVVLFAAHELCFARVLRTRTVWTVVSILSLLYVSVRLGILFAFRDNPGTAAEFHLLDHNLLLIQKPLVLLYVGSIVGVFSFLVSYRWKEKPRYLRTGLLLTLLPMLGLGTVWGFLDELRIFYETFPFVFALAFPAICLDACRQEPSQNHAPSAAPRQLPTE